MVRRFDVYLVPLDPTRGAEMRKTRPCVVVSPDEMNRHLKTVIVAPMTSTPKSYPFRPSTIFKRKSGSIALDQLRAIDKGRLHRKIGQTDAATSAAIASTLVEMFSLAGAN